MSHPLDAADIEVRKTALATQYGVSVLPWNALQVGAYGAVSVGVGSFAARALSTELLFIVLVVAAVTIIVASFQIRGHGQIYREGTGKLLTDIQNLKMEGHP